MKATVARVFSAEHRHAVARSSRRHDGASERGLLAADSDIIIFIELLSIGNIPKTDRSSTPSRRPSRWEAAAGGEKGRYGD